MPEKIITTIGMSAPDLYKWLERAKRGEAYSLEGAFGDTVYVPKVFSDIDPQGTELKNRLQLEGTQRIIDYIRKTKGRNYPKSLFGLPPMG